LGQPLPNSGVNLIDRSTENSGQTFGIWRGAGWLIDVFLKGEVALIFNSRTGTNGAHDLAQLQLSQGNLTSRLSDSNRSGWGGRLGRVAQGNVVSVTASPNGFTFGPQGNGLDINSNAIDNRDLISIANSRDIGLNGFNLERTNPSQRDQANEKMGRALGNYYAALERNRLAEAHQKALDHERSIRMIETLVSERIEPEQPDIIRALSSGVTAASGDAINPGGNGNPRATIRGAANLDQQIRNLYDVLSVNQSLGARVISLDNGSWDTHGGQRQNSGNTDLDDPGVQRGIETLFQDLFKGPYVDQPDGVHGGFSALQQALSDQGGIDQSNLVYCFGGEFGRQIRDNGGGTDHGQGNMLIVAGTQVQGGLYGNMFPNSEIDLYNLPKDRRASIAALTDMDLIFGNTCDWVSSGLTRRTPKLNLISTKQPLRTAFGFLLLVLFPSLLSSSAYARSQYLDFWEQIYSESRSSETGCQLCHERSSGGNGWNYYGWSIRVNLGGQTSVGSTVFRQRTLDVELDPMFDIVTPPLPTDQQSRTFFDEINDGLQPGWRDGIANVVRFRNETSIGPQLAPSDLCGKLDTDSQRRPCEIFDPRPSSIPQGDIEIVLEPILDSLTAPLLAVQQPGSGEQKLLIVQQGGEILSIDTSGEQRQVFFDLSNQRVANYGNVFSGSDYDERGLLGFAFHPDFSNNKKFYTYLSKDSASRTADFRLVDSSHSPDHLSVISEWTVIDDSTLPIVASEEEILIIEQPDFNHNGGTLLFDPQGLLIVSLGDGGSANDNGPGHSLNGNAQDQGSPLGTLLRVDVDGNNSSNGRYGIPNNNPFANNQNADNPNRSLPEVIASGFRNPFRLSINPTNESNYEIYVGDVGQNDIEEIDRINSTELGGNYGWRFKEGSFFFILNGGAPFISDVPPVGQVTPPLIDPIAEYDRDEGFSVIGGYVYRGTEIEQLTNRYVFADYSRRLQSPNGRLFYLDAADQIREFDYAEQPNVYFTGFSLAFDDELYVLGNRSLDVTSNTGVLLKIRAPKALEPDEICVPIKSKNDAISVICL